MTQFFGSSLRRMVKKWALEGVTLHNRFRQEAKNRHWEQVVAPLGVFLVFFVPRGLIGLFFPFWGFASGSGRYVVHVSALLRYSSVYLSGRLSIRQDAGHAGDATCLPPKNLIYVFLLSFDVVFASQSLVFLHCQSSGGIMKWVILV